jgi:hypothetical protein
MFMEIPPYLNVTRDGDVGPVSLSVQDANVRRQREMWGKRWQHRLTSIFQHSLLISYIKAHYEQISTTT